MRTRHTRKLLSSALGLIVLGCLWFWFAPVGLGGSTSYVVTHGVSMEPRFHTGDLAIVRSQSSYHVGEVVAYDNKMLHTIVLHRIVGRAGARYIFKGDNNNFVDFEHPAASQLIGGLWLHVPGVGATLQSIGSPALIGVFVAVGVFLLAGAVFTRRRRRRGRERRAGEHAQSPPRRLPRRSAGPTLGVLMIGLLALLPFVVLALLAFTRPATAPHPYTVSYEQSGKLSYTAAAPPGPTYPDGQAATGDPLFTHVVKTVDFTFGYRLHAAGRRALTGKLSLDATVTSTDGWQTTLELAPPTRFHGSRAQVVGTLDLASLLALIRSVERTTKASGSYTLVIVPHVSTSGSVDALPVHTTFAPKVAFSLNELEAQPVVSGGGGASAGSSTAAQPAANPFAPSASGSATGSRPQPLSLSFGVARVSVATARTIATVGIAIVVVALLAILALWRALLALVAPRPRDESATIQARYGRMIVPVARVWQLPGVPVIDVADMDALARISEHYDRSILHETTTEGESFWVTDESGQFRYAIATWAEAVQESEVADEVQLDTLVHEVYADELELGGAISASEAQATAATAAASGEDDWEVDDPTDAIAPEGGDWHTIDVRRARPRLPIWGALRRTASPRGRESRRGRMPTRR
jgi:signal peptidase I